MDEYISREAVLKKLQIQLLDLEVDQDKGEYSELCENRGARDALDEAIYDIRTLKAADVQPIRHGRWTWDSNAPYREHGAYKCSNCGCHSEFKENYCYGCGARMDLKDGDAE